MNLHLHPPLFFFYISLSIVNCNLTKQHKNKKPLTLTPKGFTKQLATVANPRRSLLSDAAEPFVGWAVASSDKITPNGPTNDLSLGFNASQSHHWHSLPPELGMFVVAPNSTPFHTTYPNPLLSSAAAANHPDATHLWQGEPDCGGGGGEGGPMACLDCGNQAKKDCNHLRCRTCCRSRGYDCRTHVKSTWVPSARRRERQLVAGGGASNSVFTSGPKKPRVATTNSHTSTSNNTPTSSTHQDAAFKESLPGQIVAPAVFKCVRVTSMEDGENEFAYQAVVKIRGHVFKGILYDRGPLSGDCFPNLSDLHLDVGGGSGGGGGGAGRNGESSSSPLLDPSNVYGGGSTYGNTIN